MHLTAKKKVWLPMLFLLLFALPAVAQTMEATKTCLIGKPCQFTVRTVNGSNIVNESVCNITIWNSSQDIIDGPNSMENQTNGFQNYTYYFQVVGNYNVGIECLYGGLPGWASQDVVVSQMLENAGLLAFIPLGVSAFFVLLAFYLKDDEYTNLRTLFILLAITFVWGSLSAGMEIARADAYETLYIYLRSLWYAYTVFMVAFWGIYIYTIVLPRTLEWLKDAVNGKNKGLKW